MKTCSKCKRLGGPNDFSADARHSDGLQSWCKKCDTAASSAYYWSHLPAQREPYVMSAETKAKMSASHRGRPWSASQRASHKPRFGPANNFWRGGIAPMNKILRSSAAMKDWRCAVFSRDQWTCVACGTRGAALHADHIKPFALFPDSRFDLANGRTLCVPCHRATPTYAGRTRVRT